jgi:hypothetical protein
LRRFHRPSLLVREIAWAAEVRGKRAADWMRRCCEVKVTTLDGTAMLLLCVAVAAVILSACSVGHSLQYSQSAAAREGPTVLPAEPTR